MGSCLIIKYHRLTSHSSSTTRELAKTLIKFDDSFTKINCRTLRYTYLALNKRLRVCGFFFSILKVAFTKAQSSQKKCGRIASGGWVLKNAINDDIVITFKSDGQRRQKGFEAVYTLVPQDACMYLLCHENSLSVWFTMRGEFRNVSWGSLKHRTFLSFGEQPDLSYLTLPYLNCWVSFDS